MADVEVEDADAPEAEQVEEEAASLFFSVQGVKGLSGSAKLVSWCKTMDVVAIVTQENQIALHRLNWQRIWTATETRDVTSLSWKSDGKAIVTGFADGHYAVWDIENGLVSFSTVKHGTSSILSRTPIALVDWSCQEIKSLRRGAISKQKRYADPGRSTLAPLWPLQGVDAMIGGVFSSSTMEVEQAYTSSSAAGESSTTRLERSEPASLNILTASHVDGNLHLYALGTFEIGHIDVAKMLKQAQPSLNFHQLAILATHFSPDHSRLHMIVHLRAKDDSVRFGEDGGEIGPDGTTALLTVDTTLLQSKMSEVLAVVWQSTLIQDLYYRIAAVTEKMALLWSDAITPFVTKMKHFQDQLIAEFPTVEAVFLALLACGTRSSTLDTLLVVNLGSKAAETMMKTFESTCDQLEHLVNQHLRPTAERLMYRLIALNSYGMHSRAFSALGLSTTEIATMMEVVQNIISHCANFVLHLTRSRQLYMNFLKWLYLKTFEEDDEQPKNITVDTFYIGQFLKGDIRADPIGQLIRGYIGAPANSASTGSGSATGATGAPGFIGAGKPVASQQPATSRLPVLSSMIPNAQSSQLQASSQTSNPASHLTPAFRGLDDSNALDMDGSLNYSYISLDPPEDANMSMAISEGVPSLMTPLRGQFRAPMTSSPEASNMGPIQLIDLPSSLDILADESMSPLNKVSVKTDFAPPKLFHSLQALSFSGLRNSVHQQAEKLFNSISRSLSTHYKFDSILMLFTRPELLKSDIATEVFPIPELVPVMQAEHAFQFVDLPDTSDPTGTCLLFKDASSFWVLKTQRGGDSFQVSGIEIASQHDDDAQAFSDEILVDVRFYKDLSVMALLRPLEENRCQLQKLSMESLEYYSSKADVANTSMGMINYFDDVVMMHPFQHTSEDTILGLRDFSLDALAIHLSGPRGVGFILGAPRKCLVLDLDNNETPEEEEEAAEEGEEVAEEEEA